MPTLNTPIAANADDGFVVPGTSTFDASNVYISLGRPDWGGGQQYEHSWLRFTNITIPKMSIINTAYITVIVTQNSATSPTFTIKSNTADNATAPTTAADFTGRSRSTASTSWNPAGGQSAGASNQSPSISAVIKEITDRTGWASGNAILLLLDTTSTADNVIRYASLENTSYTEAYLYVDYSPLGKLVNIANPIVGLFEKMKRRTKLYQDLLAKGAIPLGKQELLPI